MHVATLVAVLALSSPWAAVAQTPPPAAPPSAAAPAAPANPAGITRDEYIQRAQDRAGKAAAARFDEMDANHDGVLTRDELRAYHAAHPRQRAMPTPQ